jgi:hypothetical protein
MATILAASILILIALAAIGGLFLYVAGAGATSFSARERPMVWLAITAPLLITFVATQFAYSTGQYPWISPIAHIGLAIGVLVGLALFCALGFRSWLAGVVATCGYLVFLSAASLAVGVFTACGNGDCL